MSYIIQMHNCRNLIVKTYVIGYRERGESIVVLFLEEGKVLYSIVIDSYKTKDGEFLTSKILQDNHVEHINILCWTHPDADHSVGIEEIFELYCDKKSLVYIPNYMNGKDNDPIDYNKDDQARIAKLFSINDRNHKCIKPVSANSGGRGDMIDFSFSDAQYEIKIQIEVYAPHNDYLVENIIAGKKIKKNDLSIFLILKVGPYMFDFCGDTENRTISHMDEIPFNEPLFLKIPHHASGSSDKMLNRLKITSQSMSCTTTYYSQGLPQTDMLNRYKSKFQHLHSTGLNKNDSFTYGVLEYVFDLFGSKEIHIIRHGSACKM